MNKVLIISTLVVVGIGLLGLTLRGPESHQRKEERAIEWISSELDLTEEQQVKLGVINDELRDFRYDMRKDRAEIKDEFVNMLGSDRFDQTAVVEWIGLKQKQVDNFAPIIVAKFADFHESLSPEQRATLVSEIREHYGEHKFERRDLRHGDH